MRKKVLRCISLILVLITLLLSLLSCSEKDGGKHNEEAKGQETSDSTVGTSGGKEEDPYLSKLPKEDYGGKDFNILCPTSMASKIFYDDYTGDIVADELVNRKYQIEERLKLKSKFTVKECLYSDMSKFVDVIFQDNAAGAHTYDLVMSYTLAAPLFAMQNLCYDLNDRTVDNFIDFSNPWWNERIITNTAVDGKVYFAGDTCSWNTLRNMLCLTVDTNLAAEYHVDIEALYDHVENKTWTMETFFGILNEKGVYFDTDKDGERTAGDTYGLSFAFNAWIEAWFYASGYTTTTVSENGNYVFNFNNPAVGEFMSYLTSKFRSDYVYTPYDPTQYKMFREGRCLFYTTTIGMSEQNFDTPYTVLPFPVYYEGDEYSTHMCNGYELYLIPSTAQDFTRSTAYLEVYGYENHTRVAPAYFEKYLKARKSTPGRMADMYDIIRANVIYDFGYIYGEVFGEGLSLPAILIRHQLFTPNMPNSESIMVNEWTPKKSAYEAGMTNLLTQLRGKKE